MSRVIIYTKDVSLMMGVSDKTAREVIKKIRICVRKEPGIPLTVFDLGAYMNMDAQYIIRIINAK
ncbi:MAG: hypothetical protein CFE23_14805 [Flavobacterium sp. BFFFF1]|uniref:hypothetical protein n=1 Tax=Flavobacterium sp. BFFFF1 TaxID=2015557 RepID=UPI000BDDDD1B|nr:hypothetical protein [Flavobacterium sp. BFFFF1]OYU79255.1 MAG: hypothetical protein CFE23_14805 [Flavobacterium sp. BFFFF1]